MHVLARWRTYLYVVESFVPAVVRYAVYEGGIGPCEVVARLPGCVPDGVCFGRSGNLYVSCFRPNTIYAIHPNGAVSTVVDDPDGSVLNRPTNLAFAGAARDSLIASNFGSYHLARVGINDVGAGLHYPSLTY